MIEAFADVNVLALEFNHCERMERMSGRPRFLVQRVLGAEGHLSNDQAADAVRAIARASDTKSLKHLVQLHLSRDCNLPSLAQEAGRAALAEVGSAAAVTTAQQYAASRIISLDGDMKRMRPARPRVSASLRLRPRRRGSLPLPDVPRPAALVLLGGEGLQVDQPALGRPAEKSA